MIRNKEQTSVEKPRRAEPKRGIIPRRDDAVRKGTKSQNAIIRYFQDTAEELRKVSWPTREQTIRLTLIVLGSTVAAAIFLGLLDFIFHELSALLI